MNKKNTKRSLLLSVLSLLMCCSMLVGSTFAWFTDSVVSGSNVIKSGNLDVEVQYTLDGETWNNLDGAKDLFQKGLWEPGHTEVVVLKVENKGSLALKYTANMNIVEETIGKTKDGQDIKLSDYLTVSTLTFPEAGVHPIIGINMAERTIKEAFKNEDGILYGTPVAFTTNNVLGLDKNLSVGAIDYVAVKVDMPETVGNEANHDGKNVPSINFGLNVLATQYTSESDSFGPDYDKDATYPVLVNTVAELTDALINGKNVSLGADLKVDGDTTITVANGKESTLNLNGHKLISSSDETGSNRNVIDVRGELTVENGVIEYEHTGENMGWGSSTNVFNVTAGGVLNIKNATIKNLGGSDMAFAVHLNNWGEVTLNVENSTLESPYVAVRVFNSGYDMNNVTIKNSTIKGGSNALWVHNYTIDDFKTQEKVEAQKALLNFDIADASNTFIGSNAAPIRLGFTNGIFVNADAFE